MQEHVHKEPFKARVVFLPDTVALNTSCLIVPRFTQLCKRCKELVFEYRFNLVNDRLCSLLCRLSVGLAHRVQGLVGQQHLLEQLVDLGKSGGHSLLIATCIIERIQIMVREEKAIRD